MPITRTPWIDDDGTGTTGTIINNAEKQALYNQIDAALVPVEAGAWTPYTPTWNTTAVAPTIGNGSLVGAYIRNGKLLYLHIVLAFGTTTNPGTGAWFFSTPMQISGLTFPVPVLLQDASVGAFAGVAYFYQGGASLVPYAASAPNGVSGVAPFLWANGDSLSIGGVCRLD